MKKILLIVSILCLVGSSIIAQKNDDFFAYYTSYGQTGDITGEYSDVIVKIKNFGEIVFSRSSGFLPFFNTGEKSFSFDEIIKRIGDGDDKCPDKDNKYSYVRIIKKSSDEILVHWRYMPDYRYLEPDGVVHEYFYLYPDGRVRREIKEGKSNLVDYRDPRNKSVQELQLTAGGIKQISYKTASKSQSDLPRVKGNEVKQVEGIAPAFWLKFDGGLKTRKYSEKDFTVETISGKSCKIDGNISLYKSGVSGTALAFDGYKSNVVVPQNLEPEMNAGFTISAWLVVGAYPWSWSPIIDLAGNEQLYFGINDIGQLGFRYVLGPDTLHFTTAKEIPLNKWTQVAVSVSPQDKKVTLFIDGIPELENEFKFDELEIPNIDMFVGLNRHPLRTTYHVSRDYPPYVRTPEGNQPMIFGLEGLIDELQIYSEPLTTKQVNNIFNSLNPGEKIINNPDIEKRILPGEVNGQNAKYFGAYYTKLKYHDLWDNMWRTSDYPDVVVRFDDLPVSVVYWRGPNYGPGWVTENNIWMCDQSSEIYNYYGCAEHMADKQNRYSHVRIIEDTPARVLIHWRYAASDITYALANRKVWTDEYHYIYPDGTAVRYVKYRDEDWTGWQDVQFFSPPGETPEDQINLKALAVANLEGDIDTMDWTNGIPQNKIKDEVISVINFKSKYKVMVIYPEDQIEGIGAWGEQERLDKSKTHFAGPWNHWPVSQMPNDGRYAPRQDRITHSALGGGGPHDFAIYGFTDKNIEDLVPLGRFFNHAPGAEIIRGASQVNFMQSEKAYHVKVNAAEVLFKIRASKKSPVVNPAFVFENWNAKSASVSLNGNELAEGKNLRIGYVHSSGGINLIVWMKMEASNSFIVKFTK